MTNIRKPNEGRYRTLDAEERLMYQQLRHRFDIAAPIGEVSETFGRWRQEFGGWTDIDSIRQGMLQDLLEWEARDRKPEEPTLRVMSAYAEAERIRPLCLDISVDEVTEYAFMLVAAPPDTRRRLETKWAAEFPAVDGRRYITRGMLDDLKASASEA